MKFPDESPFESCFESTFFVLAIVESWGAGGTEPSTKCDVLLQP